VTRLKTVAFRINSWSVRWATIALQTALPERRDLRQITIYALHHPTDNWERDFQQWMDLDRLLVQLWEAHSIRPEVVCMTLHPEKRYIKTCFGCLLPGVTDLVG